MNLLLTQPTTFSSHIMLETLADGQVAAWILELPDCRVIAESKEAAIAVLEPMFHRRMERIEVISVPSAAENPWPNFYGVLKDDAEFQEWADRFWAEKQRSDDGEPVLSIEECLQMKISNFDNPSQ